MPKLFIQTMWLMRKTWLSSRSLGFGDVLGRGCLCYQPPGNPWTWGIWRMSLVGTFHTCCDNALLGEIWCIGEIHWARSLAPSFPFAECAWYHFTLILLSPVSPWSKSLNLRVTLGTSKHMRWARKTRVCLHRTHHLMILVINQYLRKWSFISLWLR